MFLLPPSPPLSPLSVLGGSLVILGLCLVTAAPQLFPCLLLEPPVSPARGAARLFPVGSPGGKEESLALVGQPQEQLHAA